MTEDATAQGPLAFIRMRAGPYRTLFIGTLLAAVMSGALGLAPFLTIYGIVAAVDAQDATLAGAAAIAAMGVLATALHLLLAAAAVLGGHKTAFAIQRDLRLELLRRISDAPISRVEGRAGEIKKTVLGDVDRLEGLLAHVLPDIAAGLSATVAGSLILAFVDWRLFLASLCLLPVALFAQMWTYGGRTELFERWGTAEANANAALLSYVRGIATLRAFNRQASTLRNVRSAIEELRDLAGVITNRSRYSYSLFNSVLSTNLLAVLPLALLLHGRGVIDNAQFVLAVTLGAALVAPLNKVVFATLIAERSSVAVGRIRDILGIAPLPDAGATALPDDNTLRLEGVHFSYPNGTAVLNGIDLTIPQGATVAIVGPSGAGKSTLARLLLRMEDPGEGRLSLGGVDLRDLPLANFRQRIGAVFQDALLFHGTIEDNLRLARPEAATADLVMALRRASAERIGGDAQATLALGISDRGQRLSGGEKQRVAIARALVKDAPVLLLDEATASVDATGEAAIRHAIAGAASGRTMIVVAHKLNTILGADMIVVLAGGRVEACGTHESLLARSHTYRRLFEAQERALGWTLRNDSGEGTV